MEKTSYLLSAGRRLLLEVSGILGGSGLESVVCLFILCFLVGIGDAAKILGNAIKLSVGESRARLRRPIVAAAVRNGRESRL